MLTLLIVLLALGTLGLGIVLLREVIAQRVAPRAEAMVLGAVTNFLDTLGCSPSAPMAQI